MVLQEASSAPVRPTMISMGSTPSAPGGLLVRNGLDLFFTSCWYHAPAVLIVRIGESINSASSATPLIWTCFIMAAALSVNRPSDQATTSTEPSQKDSAMAWRVKTAGKIFATVTKV